MEDTVYDRYVWKYVKKSSSSSKYARPPSRRQLYFLS